MTQQLASDKQISYIQSLLSQKGFDSVSAVAEQVKSDLDSMTKNEGSMTMTEASIVINYLKMKETVTAKKTGSNQRILKLTTYLGKS